jgi:hypothetical protein
MKPALEEIVEGTTTPRQSIINKISRHFSKRHFGVQASSGVVCTLARMGVAFAVYKATGNIGWTVLATQAASGVSYAASYVGFFFPRANKDKYVSLR